MVKIFTALFMASQSPMWIPYGIFRRNIRYGGIKKQNTIKIIAFIFKFLHHKKERIQKKEKSEILFKLDNIKTSS